MTAQSVSWARHVVDTLFGKAAEPVIANLGRCEQVCTLLGDDASRLAYRQELAYKILYHFLGNSQRACELTGGPSLQAFLQDCRKAAEDSTLPEIRVEGDRNALLHSLVCTFYYGQYVYGDIGPRPGDVMLDCGACYGDTAIWAARQGARQVFSFEIDPANLGIMRNTFQRGERERERTARRAVGPGCGAGRTVVHRQSGKRGGRCGLRHTATRKYPGGRDDGGHLLYGTRDCAQLHQNGH